MILFVDAFADGILSAVASLWLLQPDNSGLLSSTDSPARGTREGEEKKRTRNGGSSDLISGLAIDG